HAIECAAATAGGAPVRGVGTIGGIGPIVIHAGVCTIIVSRCRTVVRRPGRGVRSVALLPLIARWLLRCLIAPAELLARRHRAVGRVGTAEFLVGALVGIGDALAVRWIVLPASVSAAATRSVLRTPVLAGLPVGLPLALPFAVDVGVPVDVSFRIDIDV